MILYIRSDESNVYFPENKPWHFKVHLKSPLMFNQKWLISLLEFDATATKSRTTNQTLLLYSNICSESVIDGEKKPILRRISMTKLGKWSYIFNIPIYLSVTKNEIYEFEIYIRDLKGNDATFLQDPVLITLQFKPQS